MKNNIRYVFICLLCLLFFQTTILAQQIKRLEYWVDENITDRSKLTISPNTTFVWENLVDLPNLNNGLHTFSIRFADESGRWSPVQSHFFISDRNTGIYKVSKYEYWTDNNTTTKIQNNINDIEKFNWESLVDLPNLNNGLHTFSVRFADENGRWSPVQSHFFVNDRNSGIYKVSKYEYWTDTNTTTKVQNNITDIESFNWENLVDLPNLNNGLHMFSVRFADDGGRWSPVQSHFFVNDRNSGIYKVSKYEYWTDNNTTTKIQNNINGIEKFNWESLVDLPNLNNGLHTFSVRFADESGRWSPVQSHFFVNDRNSGIYKVSKYEYWTDNNTTTKIQNNINGIEKFNWESLVDLPNLNNGLHTFSVRFADDGGRWSPVQSHFFIKDRSNINGLNNNTIIGYRIWFDNENDFNPYYTHTTSNPIAQINDSLSIGFLPKGKHGINFQFKDLNGVWSTVLSNSVEQIDKPFFNFTANITDILENNSVKFSPSTLHFIDSIAWSFGDGSTEVSYEPTHNYTSIGEYDVIATVWHRSATEGVVYERTKYISVSKASGMNKVSTFGIKLFPLPFDNYITIQSELASIKGIKLLLPNGKIIKQIKCNNTNLEKVEVQEIPSGLIIIVIETDKGIVSSKVLKK